VSIFAANETTVGTFERIPARKPTIYMSFLF
jgi:hypothetical protein